MIRAPLDSYFRPAALDIDYRRVGLPATAR